MLEQMNPCQGSIPTENGPHTRRKLAGGGKKRPADMPAGSFSRPITHHHEGTANSITLWSAPSLWCIAWRRQCFYGRTELAARTRFLQAIDPEVEQVRFG